MRVPVTAPCLVRPPTLAPEVVAVARRSRWQGKAGLILIPSSHATAPPRAEPETRASPCPARLSASYAFVFSFGREATTAIAYCSRR